MTRYLALAATLVCGCTQFQPPQTAPVERSPKPVSASFDRTWSAAIDAFATYNLPIETLDKASGLLVPREAVYLAGDTLAVKYADCGSMIDPNTGALHNYVQPTAGRFNVVIRGDSVRSTVLVRAFYGHCVSRGYFEDGIERLIAERAAARSTP